MKTPVYVTQINKFLSSSSTVLNWPALSQNCGSQTDDRATDTHTCLSSPDLFPLEPIKKCIKGLPSHLICSSDCYPFKTSVYCRRVWNQAVKRLLQCCHCCFRFRHCDISQAFLKEAKTKMEPLRIFLFFVYFIFSKEVLGMRWNLCQHGISLLWQWGRCVHKHMAEFCGEA